MRILAVAAELAPLAKTGGLGDAVAGLCNALARRGHDVRVLLPKYSDLPRLGRDAVTAVHERPPYRFVELGGEGPRTYLVDLAELTGSGVYAADERDGARFLKLSTAAAELGDALGWRADVLHCHDWHAALTPVAIRAARATGTAPPPCVLTLHNIGYQGVFGETVLDLGGPGLRASIAADAVADGAVNFLRAGLRAADAITTVSPTYAAEIRTPAFGMGLEDVLGERSDALLGILNGVDYAVWSPASDPYIDARWDATDLAPKHALKQAFRARLGLPVDGPLIGLVSRLVAQKGIDLVAAALPALLAETRASFVALGSGDDGLTAQLRHIAASHPQRVSFTEGYDEALAHHILAASDLTLVPSRYEPCGLTQMYALRYGTIPVVRATGGLADTVQHFDPATGRGTGSVFRDADPGGLLWGVRTALAWHADARAWRQLVANAMAADFSWHVQARPYEALYRKLVAARP
jgi:starch synthase